MQLIFNYGSKEMDLLYQRVHESSDPLAHVYTAIAPDITRL